MPYVSRDDSGRITALYKTKGPEALEELASTNPAVLEFLFGAKKSAPSSATQASTAASQSTISANNEEVDKEDVSDLFEMHLSDLGMIRVIEDLVGVLIEKNVIAITDLPEPAIRRLKMRDKMRKRLEDMGNILSQDNGSVF